MTESEVSIRLAEFLLSLPGSDGLAEVAIDGASVVNGGVQIFDMAGFLVQHSWRKVSSEGKNTWTGTYERDGKKLRVHSHPGVGDVVAIVGGHRVVAECKKGWLVAKRGSPERPLLATALGQALLVNATQGDVVVAAVPDTKAFRKIATQWRDEPLVKKAGIRICLVGRDENVDGLWDLTIAAE